MEQYSNLIKNFANCPGEFEFPDFVKDSLYEIQAILAGKEYIIDNELLHALNFLDMPIVLTNVIRKIIRSGESLDNYPPFIIDHILLTPSVMCEWDPKVQWNERLFWYGTPKYDLTFFHQVWREFDGSLKSFRWLYKHGLVHMLNIIPLDEDYCPFIRYLSYVWNYGPLEPLPYKKWMGRILNACPDYLRRNFCSEKRSLAEWIVDSSQIFILLGLVEYIPYDIRTKNNESLLDIAVTGRHGVFRLLSNYNFMPTEKVWDRVFRLISLRQFISRIVHHITSLPDCPPLSVNQAFELENYISVIDGCWPNDRTILDELQYLRDWNNRKVKIGTI